MIRTPQALIPYLLLTSCVLSGALWNASDRLMELGQHAQSGLATVGGPFRLVDQYGHVRSDADFRGRFLLVYFGYSDCPDVCPTTLGVIADAMDKLGSEKNRVIPIFITVDPERDTSAVLKTYLRAFGAEFVGLTGNADAIAKVSHEYHVYAAKHPLPGGGYSVDHSSAIYLMGPDGRFITFYDDESVGPQALADDLKRRL